MPAESRTAVAVVSPPDKVERIREPEHAIELGQWYWVRDGENQAEGAPGPAQLGCVTHIGSNYVEIAFVATESTQRIHLNQFDALCACAPTALSYIQGQIADHQQTVRALLADVHNIVRRLGLGAVPGLTAGDAPSGSERALAVVSGTPDIKGYRAALVKAKSEDLPALFKRIKHENKALARWMTAELLPAKAQMDLSGRAIELVEHRISAVGLYAGLCEAVVQVAEGAPAALHEPVHLLQRRHYMDEECLVAYEAGGMEFKDIGAFDRWMAKTTNRDRILPFPRCAVAFRVRRYDKEHEAESLRSFVRVLMSREQDKATFLYLRNGDQVWRVSTAIDFGEKLFPDLDREMLRGKLWAKLYAGRVDEIITDGEYKGRRKAKGWEWDNYHAFDPSSVYYDDIAAHVAGILRDHNRVSIVLQGLLDRSLAFHPHPPWQLWTPQGFSDGIKLVYDDIRALVPGAAPDFEAYRARLNASLAAGCYTVGQRTAWVEREKTKESNYTGRTWDTRHFSLPCDDDGPDTVSQVARWQPRARRAVFEWTKDPSWRTVAARRRAWKPHNDPKARIPVSLVVDADRLLNVSAYVLGDYRQFFADPRTRADYVKWAPLLLAAEDWWGRGGAAGGKIDR